jgi:hypothetical protein
MKIRDVLINIIFLLIGGFISFFVSKQLLKGENEILYLDYGISTTSYIAKPNLEDKKLLILLDDKPISNLNQYNIDIFNLTEKNYSDVPIYIELKSKTGEDFNVIQSSVVGESNLPESILSKDIKQPKQNNIFKVGYIVHTANKGDIKNPIFKASFYYVGTNELIPKIYIDYKGLRAKEFSWLDYLSPDLNRSRIIAIIVLVLYIVSVILFIVWVNKSSKNRLLKRKTFIMENFNNFNVDFSDESYKENIFTEIDYLTRLYFWQDTPKWINILFRKKKPQRNNTLPNTRS